MNALANDIETVLLHRSTVGVLLVALVVWIGWNNKGLLGDMWNDPSPLWRAIVRLAAGIGALTLVWVAALDNLYQLIAEPFRLSLKWNYQRVVYEPTDPAIRMITAILIAALVVFLALLFTRYIGSYGLQVGLLILGAIAWAPLYVLSQRMNVMVVQGADDSHSMAETIGVSVFWILRSGLGFATIIVTLLTAVMVVALIVTPLLDLLKLRQPGVTHEADGFFSELGARAGDHEDLSLRAFWRPIQRPN